MRMMQGAAVASGVKIRGLTSGAVVSREYNYEMPFRYRGGRPLFRYRGFLRAVKPALSHYQRGRSEIRWLGRG